MVAMERDKATNPLLSSCGDRLGRIWNVYTDDVCGGKEEVNGVNASKGIGLTGLEG